MKEIKLTPAELEEVKDTIKFRTMMLIQLKGLNGIPKKVWEYGVQIKIQWCLIVSVALIFVSKAVKEYFF